MTCRDRETKLEQREPKKEIREKDWLGKGKFWEN